MKKFILSSILLISFSTIAAPIEIKNDSLKSEIISELYEYMEEQSNEPGRRVCYMPNQEAIGAYFFKNGLVYSRDFFFKSPAGTKLSYRAFRDASTSSIIFSQGFLTHGNLVIVKYVEDKISHVQFVVDSGNSNEIIVDCL